MRLEPAQVLRVQLNGADRKLASLLETDGGAPTPLYNLQVKWTQHVVWNAKDLSTDDGLKTTRIVPVQLGGRQGETHTTSQVVVIDASLTQHQLLLRVPHHFQPTTSGRLFRASHSFLVFLSPLQDGDGAMATSPVIPVELLYPLT